jgi:hypothetical protein
MKWEEKKIHFYYYCYYHINKYKSKEDVRNPKMKNDFYYKKKSLKNFFSFQWIRTLKLSITKRKKKQKRNVKKCEQKLKKK